MDCGRFRLVPFDNMSDRPIKGSTDWHSYEIVLDVPPDATSINFGVLLAGLGEVWMNSAKFEVVDTSAALTG